MYWRVNKHIYLIQSTLCSLILFEYKEWMESGEFGEKTLHKDQIGRAYTYIRKLNFCPRAKSGHYILTGNNKWLDLYLEKLNSNIEDRLKVDNTNIAIS